MRNYTYHDSLRHIAYGMLMLLYCIGRTIKNVLLDIPWLLEKIGEFLWESTVAIPCFFMAFIFIYALNILACLK